jgi:hypothetical protein
MSSGKDERHVGKHARDLPGPSCDQGGTFIAPTPTSQPMWIPLVDRVTWLTPTPRNLALLTLNPPAGFTGVPYSEMTSYLRKKPIAAR